MLTHCFIGYLNSQLLKMSTTNPRNSGTLLTGWLWNSNRVNFNFVPQVLQCFGFLVHTVFLNHVTGKSLVVLSQEIGVDTPHSSLPYPSFHSAKCD
jgi:hypothetical protein